MGERTAVVEVSVTVSGDVELIDDDSFSAEAEQLGAEVEVAE